MQPKHFPVLAKKFPFLLYYRGNYKTDLSLNIFEIVNANLSLHFKKNFVSRLSYLVIESIQNVIKYSESQGRTSDYCLVYSDQNYCHVITKNSVSRGNIENLERRLQEVKAKTTEEIEEAYNLVLRSKTVTEKGAGLGLIDMARKTGNRMEYELREITEEEWSYSLHIKLPIPNTEIFSVEKELENEMMIKEIISEYEENENTLLYSGDFSNESLTSILALLTQQYKNESHLASSIFKYALIELNQNIHRHALKSEDGTISALLAIEWLKEIMVLSTSNFISNENAEKLAAHLNSLNKSVKEKLKNSIEDRMNDTDTHGGLGLTDIARLNWPRLIEYSINSDAVYGKSINLKIKFDYER